MSSSRIAYRTCPFCEATCGLELTIADGHVTRIRGDREDVFSKGFICPKGTTLQRLEDDPDLIRVPQIRTDDSWEDATWDEAFELIERRLVPIIEEHGANAVGIYLGNPNVHNLAGIIYGNLLVKALASQNVYTAATVDQMPKHVSCALMFGHPDLIPVPDIDRTDYVLMLGADPYESNGSLATAPDWPGRVEALISRGGKLVVVDPRRSKTAKNASEHLFITPGTDALFLAALANVISSEGLVSSAEHVNSVDEVLAALRPFTPEAVTRATGIDLEDIRRIAIELANAPRAVVYSRVGTHTATFGTLNSWLVDVLNVITGNLDQPGGAMFPMPAHERPRTRRAYSIGRWTSRVRGLPEVRGQLPVSTLVDEIETEGDGQIRAMMVVAGNPVLSTPASTRLDTALRGLEFMVSVDLYRNETSRHATVILPATPPLRRSHYDLAFYALSVRNIVNYSPPVFDDYDGMQEWEALIKLAAIVSRQGAAVPAQTADDFSFGLYLQSAMKNEADIDAGEVLDALAARTGPERYLDFMIRMGPYGDRFGRIEDGLTLGKIEASPHGIDLGPLQPRLPQALATPSGAVELAPPLIMSDLGRLETSITDSNGAPFRLIGRRQLRSNNSWMHNLDVLVRGKERCTLLMNAGDGERLGVSDGEPVEVTSAVGKLTAMAHLTGDMMSGVVSLPHGWGHHLEGSQLGVASQKPGVNSNLLSDGDVIEPLSGNAVLNGIPVTISPVG